MEQEQIEAALEEWVRELAIDPATGAPFVDGGFQIGGYKTFLIGYMPDGDPPTSGTRTHMFDLCFALARSETEATIEPLLGRLKAAALEDPELGGRLADWTRLELGGTTVVASAPNNRRGGPVIVLQASVAELELGDDAGSEAD